MIKLGFHKDTNTNENTKMNTKYKGIQIQEQRGPIINLFVEPQRIQKQVQHFLPVTVLLQ